MKRRQRAILEALAALGGETTTRRIAERTGLHVNGVAQSLGALSGYAECLGGRGGEAKWRLTHEIPAANPQAAVLRRRIRKICDKHPDEVIRALLEASFWPKGIETNTAYRRRDDDTRNGVITVAFSRDNDGWIEVMSTPDPDEMNFSHRFRTFFGGGQSPRTRTALQILAVAIKLDNEEGPKG